MTPSGTTNGVSGERRRGLRNPQVTERAGEQPRFAAIKPSDPSKQSIQEPRWQQYASLIVVGGFIILWLFMVLLSNSGSK
jgi:hypothetical protein